MMSLHKNVSASTALISFECIFSPVCTNKPSMSMKSIRISIFVFISTFLSGIIMPNKTVEIKRRNKVVYFVFERVVQYSKGGVVKQWYHGTALLTHSIQSKHHSNVGVAHTSRHSQSLLVWSDWSCDVFYPIEARNIAVNSLNQALMLYIFLQVLRF